MLSLVTAGIITDSYLPTLGDTTNSWIALFKKVHDQYDSKAPFDGNVLYGEAAAYTFVQAMLKAGRNPTRTRNTYNPRRKRRRAERANANARE